MKDDYPCMHYDREEISLRVIDGYTFPGQKCRDCGMVWQKIVTIQVIE